MECLWHKSFNKCCCIFAGINPEKASTTNTTDNASPEATPCKKLDYEDYANYFIVMSGDLLGKNFGFTLYRIQFIPRGWCSWQAFVDLI